MNIIIWDYESVWPNVWPQNKNRSLWPNKCRSLWPIFHGQVILPYILKTIWCMNIILWDYESVWPEVWPQNKCRSMWLFDVWTSYFWIIGQYDQTVNLKVNIGHCDLYFLIQWFCVISWRLFDVWTSYFGFMGQYDPMFDLKINVGLCDLYFMVQWFCHISKTIWCMRVIFSDNVTVWPKLLPQSKYKSTWPSHFMV